VGKGKRTDLEKVVRDVADPNKTFEDIVTENQSSYIKYHRGIRALYDIVRRVPQRAFKTQVKNY